MLLGAAEGARRSMRGTPWVRDWVTHEDTESKLRAVLGDDRFLETYNKGLTLAVPTALQVAGEL